MKLLSGFIFFLYMGGSYSLAQTGTEVYLFDLFIDQDSIRIENPVNISNNKGYDNQPSFSKDGNFILYSSTRNNQTDVLLFDIHNAKKTWLSNTPGGEYSPQIMPDGKSVSAVRLDPDGLQLLYSYPIDLSPSKILLKDLTVGYYTFYDQNIVSFVLGTPGSLMFISFPEQKTELIDTNPGRSIHVIPGTKSISYINKSDDSRWMVQAFEPESKAISPLVSTLDEVEDIAWLNKDIIVSGKNDTLFMNNINSTKIWVPITDLSQWGLSGITRIAVSPNLDKMAVVVDEE